MKKDEAYYQSLDKRTREYKDYKKAKMKVTDKGAGDVIETITKVTGIKKAVETITKDKDCGCDKRKDWLNKTIPLSKKEVNVIYPDKYKNVNEFISHVNKKNKNSYPLTAPFSEELIKAYCDIKDKNTFTHKDVKTIQQLYIHLFSRSIKSFSCCVGSKLKPIDRIYKFYE